LDIASPWILRKVIIFLLNLGDVYANMTALRYMVEKTFFSGNEDGRMK